MIIVAVGLLGLVLGSFVNAFVWRLHEQAKLKDKKPSKATTERLRKLSISKGRSMCPSCSHELAAKDLVPIFSWLWLRGRCRYCKKPIPDSPLVELGTAVLFAVSYACWPLPVSGTGLFEFIVWLAFLVAFVSLAVYDLRWMLLPDKIVYPLVLLAVVEVIVVAIVRRDFAYLWQPAAGALLISGLFWFLFQLSKGTWIGGGDVKLAVVLGLLAASPLRAMMVLFFASLIGTVVSIPVLIASKRNLQLKIPFGPYLLLASIIVQLYGTPIVNWYTSLFGIA